MITRGLIAILTLAFAATSLAEPAEPPVGPVLPRNLDFEADGTEPWFVPGVVAEGGWTVATSDKDVAEGKRCLVLRREKGDGVFGNVMQSFPGAAFRGKRVVLTSQVKLGGAKAGRAQMWLRVDRAGGMAGAFDNMGDRPISATEWTTATIKADIDDDAESINIGFMVIGGTGPVYIDNVALAVTDQPRKRSEGPRPTTDAELANLIAFAKVYGYVRHYHPSDPAAKIRDWEPVLLGVAEVADAKTTEELAMRLDAVFNGIARPARFNAAPFEKEELGRGGPYSDYKLPPTSYFVYSHHGLKIGPTPRPTIYFSRRLTIDDDKRGANGEETPKPGWSTERELIGPDGRTLYVRVPLTVPVNSEEKPVVLPQVAETLSINDRASRFACVIEFWNVIQHAYPYHDVVDTKWDQVLRESLWKAATDKTEEEFTDTLERMCAALHDGHGQVIPARPRPVFVLPFTIAYVGDEPVVTEIDPALARLSTVSRGDVIERIGDKTAAQLLQDAREHESSATEQFLKVRAARRMSTFHSTDPVAVTVRTPEGKTRGFTFTPVAFDALPKEAKPPMVSEPKPGIWYIDLDRVTQQDLDAVLPKLNEPGCKGVIFDLRGYPSRVGFEHLGLFTDAKMSSSQWNVPIVNWPDRQNIAWQTSSWPVMPRTPRFKGKAVWITDGRAISAAETYLGIVEHYTLGEIVGETTAGTNGNINMTPLPLGYTVIYTGMKVVKQDGTRHHGVGIKPTVPVVRTIQGIAAGKDEMLEKAIGVVEGK